MEKDIFADIQKEGEPINLQMDEEKETPTESQPENEPKDEEQVVPQEGENTPQEEMPFHEHPRWKQREQELRELRERDEQRTRELAELKAFKEEITVRVNPTGEIPEWFRELYGDNATAYQKYAQHETRREQEIEKRVLDRQENARKQQADQIAYWNRWIEDQIVTLQSEGKEFDPNELKKVMTEFGPRDDKGNLDFRKGYEIYRMSKSSQPDSKSIARKQIADTTSSRSKEKPKKDYMTPNDLRNQSWYSL